MAMFLQESGKSKQIVSEKFSGCAMGALWDRIYRIFFRK